MPKVVKIGATYYISIPSDLVKELNIKERDVFSVEKIENGLLFRRIMKGSGSVWV